MKSLQTMLWGFWSGVGRKLAYILVPLVLSLVAAKCEAAQCVTIGESNVLQAIDVPIASCTGLVVLTPSEFTIATNQWLEPISIADAEAIGSAVFLLWAVMAGFKALRKFLESPSNEGV